jgi:acetolactate synthase I/II/III large subunit
MDSIPVLAITGQVATGAIGTDAFQEADVTGITMPVTKHNELVTHPDRIAAAIKEAAPHRHDRPPRSGAGRHPQGRPVGLVRLRVAAAHRPARLPADRPGPQPHGQGGRRDDRSRDAPGHLRRRWAGPRRRREELRELAELLDLPVVTTLMARGVFPEDHELAVGMPGMHGHYAAVRALQETDLLITLGARFDDRVTGKLDALRPARQGDPRRRRPGRDRQEPGRGRPHRGRREGRRRPARQGGTGRARRRRRARHRRPGGSTSDHEAEHPLRCEQAAEGPIKPQTAIRAIYDTWGDDATYVAGVGQHQMWTAS